MENFDYNNEEIPQNEPQQEPSPREPRPNKSTFWKLSIVVLGITLFALFILIRLFNIQVVHRDYYRAKANRQHEAKIPLIAHRGNIYDRNGALIAASATRYSIAVDPSLLKKTGKVDSVVIQIAKILPNLNTTELKNKIMTSRSSFMWINRNISPDVSYKFKQMRIYPGFIVMSEPGRIYAYDDVAAQIVGCTNIDNRGLTGIELELDSVLKGKNGYAVMSKDAYGNLRPLADLPQISPQHGNSIQLTIDIDLQRIVEYELKHGVMDSKANAGSVVAVDPATGEILAMASYPNFNPNDLSTLDNNELRNHPITDLYEPGSTFKAITASAAIEEKVIRPGDMVNGFNGELDFADYKIEDDHPVGMVTFREAFAKSSNIVLSTVASRLSRSKFYKYIRDFGFGIRTGIELPGEITGKLPKVTDFDITTRRFAGFGYGIAVTPLQLVMAYAAIANHGNLYRPYIVKNIFTPKGKKVFSNKPLKLRKVISDNTAHTVSELLVNVVNNGTGSKAKLGGVSIAGKTGTAQQLINGSYKNKQYTASFAGFFPADNPKIAMVVILDKPQNNYYGGSVAAPIFRNIAEHWISLKPKILLGGHKRDGFLFYSDSVYVPSILGMDKLDAWRLLRIYSLSMAKPTGREAHKVVTLQDPAPGTFVPKGTYIYVDNKLISDSLYSVNPEAEFNARPDVVGLTLRRALNTLHKNKFGASVIGTGTVVRQVWAVDEKKRFCTLYCK